MYAPKLFYGWLLRLLKLFLFTTGTFEQSKEILLQAKTSMVENFTEFNLEYCRINL